MARKFFKLPKRLRRPFSKPTWAVASVVLIIGTIGLSELLGVTHFLRKSPTPSTEVITAGTPVVAPKQSDSTQTDPEKTPTSNVSRAQGGAVDTGGSALPTSNSSQWVISQSGYITVKSPTANAKLTDGSVISGSAKVGEIHYRLIDNVVGVVAQGTLSVVNGNFSGILHFQPKGTGGRLDVFSTDSGGVEYNEVQINVSF